MVSPEGRVFGRPGNRQVLNRAYHFLDCESARRLTPNRRPTLIPCRFTLSRFSGGRAVGEIDNGSHYRNGAADAWKHELPETIVHYVRSRFHDLLEQFYPETLVEA